MKFAEIEYVRNNKNQFVDFFNSAFKPFKTEKITYNGADGYKISLNISDNSESKYKEAITNKIKKFMEINDIGTNEGIYIEGIHHSDGKILFIINEAFLKRSSEEVVIIAGDKYITETAVCILYDKVRFLSILSGDTEQYENLWEYFISEYGVNIQLISSLSHKNCFDADIVDCKNIKLKFGRYAKKENSMYAANEKLRKLADKNTGLIKRAELIANMELSALTSY